MFDSLYIAATGMRGQQTQIDAVAQNVSNINTAGYRRSVVSYAEVAAAIAENMAAEPMTDSIVGAGNTEATSNSVRLIGAGALPITTLSLLGGELRQTGDQFNVAIDGTGFLEVSRSDGAPAYTRAGQLHVNSDGLLSVADGSPLAGRIAIPTDAHDMQIDPTGHVVAMLGDDTEPRELGRIELVTFPNSMNLKAIGGGLYVASNESGEPLTKTPGESGLGTLKQGFIENSNVQMSDELVNLMMAQRAFELNSKVVQAADQLLGITNGLYR
jgi:flagellar basal-body rod protein FlgG